MIATLLTTLCREAPPRCIRIGSRDNSRDKVSREATRRIRESRQNPDRIPTLLSVFGCCPAFQGAIPPKIPPFWRDDTTPHPMGLNESIVEDAALAMPKASLTPALCLRPSPLRSGSQAERESFGEVMLATKGTCRNCQRTTKIKQISI